MKKLFIALFLLGTYLTCSGQTKEETYKRLNNRIDLYKFNNEKTNYNYLFHEVEFKKKKVIKFIQFCTAYKLCSTAYLLDTHEFLKIVVNDEKENKTIEVIFKSNSIATQNINIRTEEHFKGDLASKFTIIVKKDTPKAEVYKIKKELVSLLKIYGIKKKNTLN
ncbi:hypothetical protein PG911_09460 [Tenacibaculum ovolyticum]|uniref:hypothetical protein n=1 Tax=Tenacibaculum ovolyticum TaxID=104270 RepID=UPI0007EC7A41|nr:hypothetical protein [Tenacibaculum ovolyticum]WBX74884.1 hypothetical protein PG911_09460 [Tenacibaculum ovolyticum]